MLDKLTYIIQKNTWGLIPNKKSAYAFLISIVIIISSIIWVKQVIESGEPKKPDANKIKENIQKYNTDYQQIIKKLNSKKRTSGFTLVELLVSISIICLLMAISTTVYKTYLEKTNYTRANNDLKVINLAFERFAEDNNDLPPIGSDHCDACKLSVYFMGYNDNITETWQDIVDIFNNSNYPFRIPKTDPWGTPYAYDKNYGQPCPAWTIICSAGPNKVVDTWLCQSGNPVIEGDDICIWIPGPFGYW